MSKKGGVGESGQTGKSGAHSGFASQKKVPNHMAENGGPITDEGREEKKKGWGRRAENQGETLL